MTTNSNTPIKTYENKQIFGFALRFLFGGVLGAAAYIAIAKMVIDQSYVGYDRGFIRGVIEVSMFLAWILVGSIVRDPESIFLQLATFGLSSIPYAVLGALIAVRAKKVIILLVVLLTAFFLCASRLLYGIFEAFMRS